MSKAPVPRACVRRAHVRKKDGIRRQGPCWITKETGASDRPPPGDGDGAACGSCCSGACAECLLIYSFRAHAGGRDGVSSLGSVWRSASLAQVSRQDCHCERRKDSAAYRVNLPTSLLVKFACMRGERWSTLPLARTSASTPDFCDRSARTREGEMRLAHSGAFGAWCRWRRCCRWINLVRNRESGMALTGSFLEFWRQSARTREGRVGLNRSGVLRHCGGR